MKKQVEKFSKKIMVLVLATSIIFTSCFSYKKINAHATSVAVGLGAYTLYEICLYIGGLAVTTLGIGYAYENRDDIAEFGKSVIDSMSDLSSQAWVLGSHSVDGDYVYGTEALQEVQSTEWTVIQGGGQSPKNDNNDDGDEDLDDRELELNLNGYFLTQAGINLFENHIKPLYDSWVNKEENNLFDDKFGLVDFVGWNGFSTDSSGYYVGYFNVNNAGSVDTFNFITEGPAIAYCYEDGKFSSVGYTETLDGEFIEGEGREYTVYTPYLNDGTFTFETNLPIVGSYAGYRLFVDTGQLTDVINLQKSYRVADWLADDDSWKGYLEDIATSLRSLQDLTAIAQALSEGALTTQPSANEYGDMMVNLGDEYAPKTDPIVEPTYYPVTNTTPKLDPSVFPNYVPSTNPDIGGGTDSPGGDGIEEVPEIDLDGLLSIFNILFYLIMIIVMLIYLFLSCLAFIVMIFRIPASSSMLPEDMVLGYEHLKTIMIPGMNISIYGFAMALIYLFIIFAVIKLIRLEINDFKFPRSYK